MIEKIKEMATSAFDEIVEIRRHLHQHPELSFQEYKTSAYIKSILTIWGIPFTENIADTGIVVLLQGNNPESKTISRRNIWRHWVALECRDATIPSQVRINA